MRRVAWLLILVLAAPLAAAQDQARPSLKIDPAVLDVAPDSTSQTRVVVTNTLARDLVLSIGVHTTEGVKARVDRADLLVPARGSEVVTLTTLVGSATGVTHAVEVVASENTTRAAATAAPIVLSAKLELRVPPVLPTPLVEMRFTTRAIDLAQNGSASASLLVRNDRDTFLPLSFTTRAPAWANVTLGEHAERLAPGAVATIPVTLRLTGGASAPTFDVAVLLAAPSDVAPPRADLAVRVLPATATIAPAASDAEVGGAPASDARLLTAGVLAAGVTGGVTALWLARRQWWPLLALLYTRLRPSRILDHPVRRRIADVVQREPGITFSDLARAAGIAPGQLTHHARMLEKAGVVFSSPDGQARRFFHVGGGRLAPVPPLAERAMAALARGPRTTSELARELGVSRQALHYHVKQLVAQGKLATRASGRDVWLEVRAAQPSSGEGRLARS